MTGQPRTFGNRISNARTLGQRVRDARKAAGLSLAELSNQVTVSSAYLHYIEHGQRTPSEEVLVEVASVLGLDVDVLLACIGRVNSRVAQRLAADPEAGAVWVRQLLQEQVKE